jgi:hypothetical protein
MDASGSPPATHSHDDGETCKESPMCQLDDPDGPETATLPVCDDLGTDMQDERSEKDPEGRQKRKTVWIEEVEDEGDEDTAAWVEDYPEAGAAYSRTETKFHSV